MTDAITGWRTVATHGQPTDDAPVLIRFAGDGAFVRRHREPRLTEPDTRWIPLAELDALPDAPPPPRAVTVTIDADDAREVMKHHWSALTSAHRVLEAVKAALEADETAP